MDICFPVLKGSHESRFDSHSVRNRVLFISHIAIRDCYVHIFFPTTFLEIAVYQFLKDQRPVRSPVPLLRDGSVLFQLTQIDCRSCFLFVSFCSFVSLF